MNLPYRLDQLVKLLGELSPGSYYHVYAYNVLSSHQWLRNPKEIRNNVEWLNDMIGFLYPNLSKTFKDGAITLYVNGFHEYMWIDGLAAVPLTLEYSWTMMTDEKLICKMIELAVKKMPNQFINPAYYFASQSYLMEEDELLRFATNEEKEVYVEKESVIQRRKFRGMSGTYIAENENEEIKYKIKPDCRNQVEQRAQIQLYKMFTSCLLKQS